VIDMRAFDAVIFDLLTALLNSWKLWNAVARSDEAGLRWRRAYLSLTYDCGPYRPYEELVRIAAETANLRTHVADELIARWGGLEPWDDVAEIVGTLSRRVPLGIATNCSM
jgi:2-haloacid dehalogenase